MTKNFFIIITQLIRTEQHQPSDSLKIISQTTRLLSLQHLLHHPNICFCTITTSLPLLTQHHNSFQYQHHQNKTASVMHHYIIKFISYQSYITLPRCHQQQCNKLQSPASQYQNDFAKHQHKSINQIITIIKNNHIILFIYIIATVHPIIISKHYNNQR
jgi:uncharacterized membrane protein